MPRKVKQGAKIARYARDRGLSAAALRSHIASGLLRSAILPDGSIDRSVADALLASRSREAAPDGPEKGRAAWISIHPT
jgi:aminoglycoside phosphotransferase (APT) family kinase protein